MATVFLHPSAPGEFNQGFNVTIDGLEVNDPSRTHEAVDDPRDTPDEDFSRNGITIASPFTLDYTFKVNTLAEVGANNVQRITEVIVYTRLRRLAMDSGSGSIRHDVRNTATGSLASHATPSTLSGSYTTRTSSYPTDPITGDAWNKADFNNQVLEFGIHHTANGGNSTCRLTQLYLEVIYDPDPWQAFGPASGNWAASPAGVPGWGPFGNPGGAPWTRQ